MEELTGRQLGVYQVMAPLGRGGLAAVYRAFQPGVGRYVALKILPRHLASERQFVVRFQQEARVLAQLQHPHIVPVLDFGAADGYAYLAMPFIEGGTLLSLMQGGLLPPDRIRRILSQVGTALDYAHTQRVIHRDVKPSNVLIDLRGDCLLADFGLAKIVEAGTKLALNGGVVGTPAYMSPEQGLGLPLDGRSDQYSLGVILYELVTGRVPYDAETPLAVVLKHIHEPLPPPRKLNPALAPELEDLLLRALAKNPSERFPSVAEFVQALQAALPETAAAPTVESVVAESAPVGAAPVAGEPGPPAEAAPAPPPVVRVAPGVSPAGRLRPVPREIVYAGLGVLALALAISAVLFLNRGGAEAQAAATRSAASTQTAVALAAAPAASPTPRPATVVPVTGAASATATPTATPTRTPTATRTAPTPTATLGIGATRVSAIDGMVSVYVPAGAFRMGSTEDDASALPYERPQRDVILDAFWIDRTEVSNAQYALCLAAGRCRPLNSPNSGTRLGYFTDPAYQDYPVIRVSWDDARRYCQWAGGRLPTEAEWEKAARGVEARRFPWGDDRPAPSRANFDRLVGDTAAVDDYPEGASPYGALNMAGNVREWVSDWFQSDYYRDAARVNPTGPATGQFRVLRGGSWLSPVVEIRAARRTFAQPTNRDNATGFRCVR